MREIKFRAWDKSGKKMGMVQVRQILIPDGNNEYGNQELAVSHLKFGTNPSHWLIAPILMQYTGLKDKNGVEIYEGDILECNSGDFFDPHGMHYSTKKKHRFVMEGNNFGDFPEWNCLVEVIGNIYENPELLPDAPESM